MEGERREEEAARITRRAQESPLSSRCVITCVSFLLLLPHFCRFRRLQIWLCCSASTTPLLVLNRHTWRGLPLSLLLSSSSVEWRAYYSWLKGTKRARNRASQRTDLDRLQQATARRPGKTAGRKTEERALLPPLPLLRSLLLLLLLRSCCTRRKRKRKGFLAISSLLFLPGFGYPPPLLLFARPFRFPWILCLPEGLSPILPPPMVGKKR